MVVCRNCWNLYVVLVYWCQLFGVLATLDIKIWCKLAFVYLYMMQASICCLLIHFSLYDASLLFSVPATVDIKLWCKLAFVYLYMMQASICCLLIRFSLYDASLFSPSRHRMVDQFIPAIVDIWCTCFGITIIGVNLFLAINNW
jgi:hypothetical protein